MSAPNNITEGNPIVNKGPLSITGAAIARVRELLEKRGKPSAGIRIGVSTRGCSGLKYTIEYADAIHPMDEVVSHEEVKVMIDPKAIMFILGSEMDFVQGELESGFTFKNPNEKGRCGCGQSFHV